MGSKQNDGMTGTEKSKALSHTRSPKLARGTETTEILATDNNRQNRTPLEINVSTRSIEADKPFDLLNHR